MVGQLFARLADGKLGKEIEENLPRLFAERSARLVPNDDGEYSAPRAFDHAVATVVTPEMKLRFVRVPGEFSIAVSVAGEWVGVDSVPGAPRWTNAGLDWADVDRFLADGWERLKTVAGA